jgi:hypothetical protein
MQRREQVDERTSISERNARADKRDDVSTANYVGLSSMNRNGVTKT